MGKMKKSGENSKAVDARNKKKAAKAEKAEKAAKSKEDAYWASQGDGQMSKGQKKKQEQEARVSPQALAIGLYTRTHTRLPPVTTTICS